MTTTAQSLPQQLAAAAAADLKLYREAVTAEATGETLPAKAVARLTDAMRVMRISAETFAEDVGAYRAWLAAKKLQESVPAIEARRAQLVDRLPKAVAEMESLQKEVNGIRGQMRGLIGSQMAAMAGVTTVVRENPRLFSPTFDPLTGKNAPPGSTGG